MHSDTDEGEVWDLTKAACKDYRRLGHWKGETQLWKGFGSLQVMTVVPMRSIRSSSKQKCGKSPGVIVKKLRNMMRPGIRQKIRNDIQIKIKWFWLLQYGWMENSQVFILKRGIPFFHPYLLHTFLNKSQHNPAAVMMTRVVLCLWMIISICPTTSTWQGLHATQTCYRYQLFSIMTGLRLNQVLDHFVPVYRIA